MCVFKLIGDNMYVRNDQIYWRIDLRKNPKLGSVVFGFIFLFVPFLTARAYTVDFVNNTGLPNGYMICAQGYAAGGTSSSVTGNFMALSLNTSTNQASFTTTSSLSHSPQVGGPLPAFPITPGTTELNITTSSGTIPILGARVYFYVVQSNTCFPYLYYAAIGNNGSVSNNFAPGGAYLYSEVTSTNDTTSGQTFDLSMVDAFAMPANAVIGTTTANYYQIGQFDTTINSVQNLVGIRSDFRNAMSALGDRGQPYLSLLASSFKSAGSANSLPGGGGPVTWPTYTYPSGTAPILNPHSLLSQFIPNPPSPALPESIFMPGVGSSLNYVFDVAVSSLFSRNSSYLNKTGISGDTFYATPVSILPLPHGYSPAQLSLLQQTYPSGLPGLALCYVGGSYMTHGNICGNQGGTLNATGWIYKPLNSTILTTQPTGLQPISGTVSASSSTLSFDLPVTLPFGVSIYGWYLKNANSSFADGFHYVTGCNGINTVVACSGTLYSVTVNGNSTGHVSSQVVFGLFPSTSKSGPNQDGSFASTGDQVFGNLGVFGGVLRGSTAALSHNTSGSDIGNILVTALNRGVSGLTQTYSSGNDPQSTDSWLWAQETNWYPAQATRNEYAFYLHTRTLPNADANYPFFSRPNTPASSADPGGLPMGMAYGFAFDENPAPSYSGAQQVPSEWNQTVGGNIVVSFGPWLSESPSQYSLAVSRTGTGAIGSQVTAALQSGSGTASFVCPETCSGTYDPGATVQLTAKSSAAASFTGWSSSTTTLNCPGTQLTCTVTMSQAQTVTATFTATPAGQYPLDVTVSGPGYGSVTSVPEGINCGVTCTHEFKSGTTVILTATPTSGGVFAGWSGCPSSSGVTCTVVMNQAESIRATFGLPTDVILTITSGAGGAVTGTAGVKVCRDATCTDALAPNTPVTLRAAPVAGYKFSGWSGACASAGTGSCVLYMTTSQAVSAAFTAIAPGNEALTVHVDGSGSVAGSGISCPTACSQDYAYLTLVNLVASPAVGYQFAGWYGACAGTSTTCNITMDQTQSVTARFVAVQPRPPNPIPALSEWARLLLTLGMIGAAGWYSRRVMIRR